MLELGAQFLEEGRVPLVIDEGRVQESVDEDGGV